MDSYVVATVKPWNITAFSENSNDLRGRWFLVTRPEELTLEYLTSIKPRYVFFPHWSWIVPEEITAAFECVCFHMTDVPYGRGGSPLQNLISRGHTTTKLTALRMESELDAGPVYGKLELSLEGSAQEIFERTALLIYDLIGSIIEKEPAPVPQQGDPVLFERRSEEQSLMPEGGAIGDVFNHIRMLDAETYPRAFLQHGEYKYELFHAELGEESIECRVRIVKAR
jgi:methionyl-tRNA formyltransferase